MRKKIVIWLANVPRFIKYGLVGLLNTATHYSIFFLCFYNGMSQAVSNIASFIVAVTVSYFLNAHYTFSQKKSWRSYLLFAPAMAVLNYAIGHFADVYTVHPLLTLIASSFTSLVLGYFYSKYIVFS